MDPLHRRTARKLLQRLKQHSKASVAHNLTIANIDPMVAKGAKADAQVVAERHVFTPWVPPLTPPNR
jgi:hypothetical protein